ncbi:hypothetical protein [Advenella sp. FME57]|uniref:hypothetical protein n=1 Tax=Advenella sp. FME57 TaxID=2742604 RepID=UPI00186764C1|nr:hypothetical protein [Advenella sp. FME57]
MPHTLTRSILTILIPGLFALCPWLLLLHQYANPQVGSVNPILLPAIVITLAAVLGSIFEGLGSHFEASWDNCPRMTNYEIEKNWHIYLASALEPKPIGYSYLAKIVTSLYFELAMIWASPIFIIGLGAVVWQHFSTSSCLLVICMGLASILAVVFFWWQARSSHEVLCKTRQRLNVLMQAPS